MLYYVVIGTKKHGKEGGMVEKRRTGKKRTGKRKRKRLPSVLTEDEVIKVLRLDEMGLKFPREALRHLRRMGRLGYLKVGRRVLIPESALESYIEKYETKINV